MAKWWIFWSTAKRTRKSNYFLGSVYILVAGGSQNALIPCEDERDLASAVKRVLEYAKFDVDVAHDGLEALDYFAYQTYDAIILDIMMPK